MKTIVGFGLYFLCGLITIVGIRAIYGDPAPEERTFNYVFVMLFWPLLAFAGILMFGGRLLTSAIQHTTTPFVKIIRKIKEQ